MNFLRAQALRARLGALLALAAGLGALALAAYGLSATALDGLPPAAKLGLGLLLVPALISWVAARRWAARAAHFRGGLRGEDALERALARCLGDDYTLYRNLRLPGRRGDLDAVLLGPPGVVLLENKAYAGEFVLFGDRWYRAAGPAGGDMRRWHSSPTAQAARNADLLAAWLARHGLGEAPVHALVVLSSGRLRESRRAPSVPVVPLDDLPAQLLALPRARRLDRRQWADLAAAFDALNDAGGA